MSKNILNITSGELKAFCEKNEIKKLSLFGSYAAGTNDEQSDIDLLVEFYDDANPGLLDISRMERKLSEMFDKKVDLRTLEGLSRFFRDTVVKEAEIKYESSADEPKR